MVECPECGSDDVETRQMNIDQFHNECQDCGHEWESGGPYG